MSFCFLGFFISNKRPLSEIYGGHLLERGVYRIFLGLYWAFIGEGHLKESGCLLENKNTKNTVQEWCHNAR